MSEHKILDNFIDLDNLPYHTIEKKFLYIKWINLVIWYLLITIGVIVAMIMTPLLLLHGLLGILGWTILCVLLGLYSKREIQNRKYALTEDFIVYHSGLFLQTTAIIPLTRVQHTSLNQGWISRKFGLGSLVIFTAGNQGETLIINGLTYESAKKNNSFLLNHIDDENETSLNATDEE